jgi:hypothetical protein
MKRDLVLLGLLAALLLGCDKKSEIKVYRVSKAPLEESGPVEQNAMPTNAASPSSSGGLTSVASKTVAISPNWEPQRPSQMRQASFLVKGDNGAVADISLVSLGSSAGNVLDNVNRWLSQLGQPSITAERLSQIAQQLTTSIGQVTIVDLAGLPRDADPAKDGRIIAAIAPAESATLFFKIRGNTALTEEQKPEFVKWVAAVCNAQTESKPPQVAAMPSQDSTAPQLKWKTPEGWNEVPSSTMRYASFNAPGENGAKIDISVVTFPGDGGSDADNVNRWRRQIGLAPMDENAVSSEVNSLKTADTNFSTTDIAGSEARTIAAWARRDGRVWFFKMTGPSGAVEKQKPKFFEFVRSIQFNS